MKYVVIGGAGAMGRITVRDLYEFAEPEDRIVIADYDHEKAQALAKSYGDEQVVPADIDARNLPAAAKVLRGCFAVINCIQHHHNLRVMEAALQAGCHYLDLGGLFHMTRRQLALHEPFRAAGKLAILGIGAAPGITNVLARLGADELDSVHEIHCRVAGIDQTRYKNPPALPIAYSLQTILEEFSTPPAVFTKGKLTFAAPMSGQTLMRFPAPVGVQNPMFTIHSELATLPQTFAAKGVKEVSFKIAFEAVFTDRVRFLRDLGLAAREPISVGGVKVAPIELVNRVAMSQTPGQRVGPLRQYEVVRTILKGSRKGKKVTMILDCHTRGYLRWGIGTDINTGAPPAVVARMLAVGEITGSGVLPPEVAIPPEAFFRHLQKRGLWLERKVLAGWSLKT